jgi:hypothetical protein
MFDLFLEGTHCLVFQGQTAGFLLIFGLIQVTSRCHKSRSKGLMAYTNTSIDTARSCLLSSSFYVGLFVVMGVLGEFQSAGFLHFCRLFKKPAHEAPRNDV